MVETQFNLYPTTPSPLLVQGGGISDTNPCNEALVEAGPTPLVSAMIRTVAAHSFFSSS